MFLAQSRSFRESVGRWTALPDLGSSAPDLSYSRPRTTRAAQDGILICFRSPGKQMFENGALLTTWPRRGRFLKLLPVWKKREATCGLAAHSKWAAGG
jgi:hypothetical protein